MDRKHISETSKDSTGFIYDSEFYNEFDLFNKCIDKMNDEIVSIRKCYDYILKEIEQETGHISNLMKWNQKN